MEATVLKREFRYNGLKLPDIDKTLSPEEVKTAYAVQYPELATASVTGPEVTGQAMVYNFSRAIGVKG